MLYYPLLSPLTPSDRLPNYSTSTDFRVLLWFGSGVLVNLIKVCYRNMGGDYLLEHGATFPDH